MTVLQAIELLLLILGAISFAIAAFAWRRWPDRQHDLVPLGLLFWIIAYIMIWRGVS